MPSKQYLKIMSCILILLLLSVMCLAQNTKQNDSAIIVRVAYKMQNNKLWVLNYILIDDKVYSGDFLVGLNFTCTSEISKPIYDSLMVNYKYPDTRLIERKFDHIPYSDFKTQCQYIDTNFFWKAIIIPLKFILLPCVVETPDFFNYIYKNTYNGIQIVGMNNKKIRKSNLPDFFVELIKQNKLCF